MKIKDLKFEDIAYYVDSIYPSLKKKYIQLNKYTLIKDSKFAAQLIINVALAITFFYVVGFLQFFGCSLKTYLIMLILIGLLAIYLNSKIIYLFKIVEKCKINPYETILKTYFYVDNFEQIKSLCVKNGVINDSGLWIFNNARKKRKRDISVFIAKLNENGLFKNEINMKEVHHTFSNYFEVNFDYAEMTKVITEVKDQVLNMIDENVYEKFNFLDKIENKG